MVRRCLRRNTPSHPWSYLTWSYLTRCSFLGHLRAFTPNDWINIDNKGGMEGRRIGLEESTMDTLRLV